MPASIVSLLLGGAGIAVALITSRAQARKRADMLRVVAERLRGTVTAGMRPRLELTRDGVRVEVSLWSTKNGSYTEVWAHLPAPGTAAFEIRPRQLGDRVGTLLGGQDIEVGHAVFDERFIIKGRDPELVKRLWDGPNRMRVLRQQERSRIDSDGNVLHLLEPRIEGPIQIEMAIQLVLELARADVFGLDAVQDLPEAVMEQGGRFPHARVPGPQPVVVGPVEVGGQVHTVARTSGIAPAGSPPPPAAGRLVAAIAPGRLEIQRDATCVVWPSIEDDRARLTAAVELLRLVTAGPSLGVFR